MRCNEPEPAKQPEKTEMSPTSNSGFNLLLPCILSAVFQVDTFWITMTLSPFFHLFLFPFVSSVMAATEPAGCKIRITDKGLEMCKYMDICHFNPEET